MDNEAFYQITSDGHGEYEEKKSRFIAVLTKAENEEEAETFIREMKKKCHDARHNCSAYIVTGEDGRKITRFSDDGEPSKTAGQPILAVLEHEKLINCVCVVTRYFGGILLGTGGLVRAYTDATKAAVADAAVVPRQRGCALTAVVDYKDLARAEYLLREKDITPTDMIYEEKVRILCKVPTVDTGYIEDAFREMSGGGAILTWDEESWI